MGLLNKMASSSSSNNRWTHDVFLSFRGKDTRTNFTSHLNYALCSKGINTFIDNNLERGEDISPSLLRVIERSRISIVVFSQDYASSTYCLDELMKILDCRKSKGQMVFPIFYKVDPTDVEEQKGRFGKAFAKHEATFMENLEKVRMWRVALAKAAILSGWPLDDNGDEAIFIQSIVEKVLTKLNRKFLHVAEYPVGLDFHIQNVSCKLSIGSNDVRMVGIHGIGGIGKTTMAKAIYNSIANQFEGSCFLANVREVSKQYSVVQLQETILFEILGDKRILMGNFDRGINEIRDRLCRKRVLIVIDDVDNVEQLKKLAGDLDWFGSGSRIIITTRDERLLAVHGVGRVHKVNELCFDDAVQLFSWNAFRKPQPIEDYLELSHCVVKYAQGLPLALVILGSSLYDRSVPEWESELDKLKRIPNKQIYEILKTSYDGLDDNEKAIFLDIACFFKGMDKDYVMKFLDVCGFNPIIGLKGLKEKSLISIENNKLQMHDLLQSMGRQVVQQQCSNISRCSRLWFPEDILHVLAGNMGADEIEGIMLDLPKTEQVHLSAEAFTKMHRLRILIIRNAHVTGGPANIPNALRWLEWPECPLESMPSAFHAKKLVVLKMHGSCIRQFGEGFKNYCYLKFMDLRDCKFLTETPDFSTIPNLETLLLDGCTNLVVVHESVGYLVRLQFLSLEFCDNLRSLPSSFKLRSLHTILLTACNKLEAFPDIVEKMECLEKVCLNGTAVKALPSSIENLVGLKVFTLTYCKNLTNLPSSIYKLSNLKHLLLEGCSKLGNFPLNKWNKLQSNFASSSRSGFHPSLFPAKILDSSNSLCSDSWFPMLRCLDLRNCNLLDVDFLLTPNCFSVLKDLDLSGNNFVSLPPSICLFTNLRSLKLSKCKKLQEIPELPLNIKRIEARDCKSLERFLQSARIFEFNKKGRSNRLHDVDFSNCHKLAANQSKILQNALFSQGFCQNFRIEMFLPGNEIPEWFSYRSEEGSISFQLPSHTCEKIVALALCTILSLKNGETANISREVFVNGQNVISFSRHFFSLESDHVWLYYFPCHFKKAFHSQQNDSVHFEVSFKVLGKPMGVTLKGCGVYLEYIHDEMVNDPSVNPSITRQMDSTSVDLMRSCYDHNLELNLQPKVKRKRTNEELDIDLNMHPKVKGKGMNAESLTACDSDNAELHQWKHWLSLSLQPMDQMLLDPTCITYLEDKVQCLKEQQ